jgi:hypothetical protein
MGLVLGQGLPGSRPEIRWVAAQGERLLGSRMVELEIP